MPHLHYNKYRRTQINRRIQHKSHKLSNCLLIAQSCIPYHNHAPNPEHYTPCAQLHHKANDELIAQRLQRARVCIID